MNKIEKRNNMTVENPIKDRCHDNEDIKYTTKDRSVIKQNLSQVEKPISQRVESDAELIVNAIINTRNHIVNEVSTNFEKKLEKLDEALLELISCKTENERLKGKIDNLTRENFRLKKEVNSFRSFMPGVFIKVKKDEITL